MVDHWEALQAGKKVNYGEPMMAGGWELVMGDSMDLKDAQTALQTAASTGNETDDGLVAAKAWPPVAVMENG